MSERWIQRSEQLLKQIKDMQAIKERDRLELIRSIRFAFGALQRSLTGWYQWMGNPDISSKFDQKELEDMNNKIIEFVTSFIEYDMKITNEGMKKGIKERRRVQRRPSTRVFYV
jgi:hypothetical protein